MGIFERTRLGLPALCSVMIFAYESAFWTWFLLEFPESKIFYEASFFSSSLTDVCKWNTWDKSFEFSTKPATGFIKNSPKYLSASRRPPMSPSQSKKLYVYLSMYSLLSDLSNHSEINLYLLSGLSIVGQIMAVLGSALPNVSLYHSRKSCCPYWKMSISSWSSC